MERKIKIVGLVGSTRENSNTEIMVREALQGATSIDNVDTEIIRLAGKDVAICDACFRCWTEHPGICHIEDDTQEIIDKFVQSDGIIVGSPVHYGGIAASVKTLIERCLRLNVLKSPVSSYRYEDIKDLDLHLPLRNKVGGALAVGLQSGGQEQAIREIHSFFLINDMFVVADGGMHTHIFHPHFGGVGIARLAGEVTGDWYGMKTSWSLGRRVAEVATIIQAGLDS